jgi:Na+/alanine symporter
MWMVAFLASTAFVEATLANNKEKHLGEFRGGPAYIERVIRVKMVWHLVSI